MPPLRACDWIHHHSCRVLVTTYERALKELTFVLMATVYLVFNLQRLMINDDAQQKALFLDPALDMVLAAILQGKSFIIQSCRPLVAADSPPISCALPSSTSVSSEVTSEDDKPRGVSWLHKEVVEGNSATDATEVHLHNFVVALLAVVFAVEDLIELYMPNRIRESGMPLLFWQDQLESWFPVFRLHGEDLDCYVIREIDDDTMFLSELRSSLHAVLQRLSGLMADGTAAQLAAFVRNRIRWAKQPFEETIDLTFLDMRELKASQDIINSNGLSTINVQRVWWCGMLFALKFFEESEREKFEQEASVQVRLQHPNVVSFVALFKAVDQHQYGILMEHMEEDLEAYLKRHAASRLDLLENVHILLQTANGMEYVHRRGMIHRDVKPQNLLVRRRTMDITEAHGSQQQLEVKVSDFGESRAGLAQCTRRVGTTVYRAPEVLNEDEKSSNFTPSYDQSIDVYSYAMTAYRVLVEKEPFDGYKGNLQALWRKVIQGGRPDLASVDDAACPPYLKHCLRNWWAKNPKTRHSFTHICCILRHLYVCLARCPRDVDPMLQFPFLTWPFWRWKRAQDIVKEELSCKFERSRRAHCVGTDNGLFLESTRVTEIPYEMRVMERAIKKVAGGNKLEASFEFCFNGAGAIRT